MGLAEEMLREERLASDRVDMGRIRRADVGNGGKRAKNNRKGAPA
jgi:hypothetical protein